MSSEVRVREEDGVMIFEKDKTDDLEAKFFNPEYFRMIGFPDAEIIILNKETGNTVAQNDSSSSGLEPEPESDSQNVADESMDQSPVENVTTDSEQQSGENGASAEEQVPVENAPTDPEQQSGENDAPNETNNSVEQPQMKGGYYDHPERLTEIFRHFVYLIQRDRRYSTKTETPESNPNAGIYGKLFGDSKSSNGSTLSSGLQTFFDRVRNALSSSPAVESPPSSPDSIPETIESSNSLSITWVVKIPITQDEEVNKFKKEELLFDQLSREYRAEKTNNIIVEGTRYDIGNRSIKILSSIKEGVPTIQYPATKLQGSKMYKMSLLGANSENTLFLDLRGWFN